MKAFILTALCALPLAAWGQPVFQREGKTLAELHTPNTDETVISAEADINKDGKINGQDAAILSRYTSGRSGYDNYFK